MVLGRWDPVKACIIALCPHCKLELLVSDEEFGFDIGETVVGWVPGTCPKCGRRYKVHI